MQKKYHCRKTAAHPPVVVRRETDAAVFYRGVMHLCKCSLWIPIRKAPRLCKVLIKIPLFGDNIRRQNGIALDNLIAVQMLGTPRSTASAYATLQRLSVLKFTGVMVFRVFIGFSWK